MTTLHPTSSETRSKEDKQAVRDQLDRILEHPSFRNSLRSARFFRYVVEYWLEDGHHEEPLKERTLGTILFGLDPSYDTSQNTVVRNAAVDVRKRLILYYLEPEHEGEIRITLPAGSYMPHIDPPAQSLHPVETLRDVSEVSRDAAAAVSIERRVSVLSTATKPFWQSNKSYYLLLSLIGLAIVGGLLVCIRKVYPNDPMAHMNELNLMWRPILDAKAPEPVTLICVEELPPNAAVGQPVTPVGNAIATADFVRVLSLNQKSFRIAVSTHIATEDLQSATVILVGGVDNLLTSYVTDGLRFHLSSQKISDSKRIIWIEDRKNPSRRDWSLTVPEAYANSAVQDYALVARVMDPKTGLWRVVASGLDGVGTGVAARTLVEANYTKEMTSHLPKDWATKNIEVVLSIHIVNGKTSYPQVVAYEVW